jgi:hypothetical protein
MGARIFANYLLDRAWAIQIDKIYCKFILIIFGGWFDGYLRKGVVQLQSKDQCFMRNLQETGGIVGTFNGIL